jgi:hypothetical protein
LNKPRSPVYKLFSESSRHNIQRAIAHERRKGGLKRRDGEKFLTATVIQAIGETKNVFASILLALIVFGLAIIFGIVLPITLLFCIFVVPAMSVIGLFKKFQ